MPESKQVVGLSWQPQLPIPSLLKATDEPRIKPQTEASSSTVWKSNSELVDGLFVPPNDPKKLNKLLRKQVKDTAGKNWFNLPAQTITPELQKDLKLLKLRAAMDPKRHYKKGDSKSKTLPKYFQMGTVLDSPLDYYSGRLTKKERKTTLADELLSDQNLAVYRKRKVREIEEQNQPTAGNQKWKIKVVEILLWDDKTLTAAVLAGFSIIWFLFEVAEYHFVTLMCHILIATMLILFVWYKAAGLITWNPPSIHDLEIPETTFRFFCEKLSWFLRKFYDISTGKDLKLFFMTITCLWIMSAIGTYFNTLNLLYIMFLCLVTLPIVYERYEYEVDYLASKGNQDVKRLFKTLDSKFLKKIPRGPLKEKKFRSSM
ncbi:Reticulon [Sesbania bispinosa]|nr:Reticulon [Sesbania bispinosa]